MSGQFGLGASGSSPPNRKRIWKAVGEHYAPAGGRARLPVAAKRRLSRPRVQAGPLVAAERRLSGLLPPCLARERGVFRCGCPRTPENTVRQQSSRSRGGYCGVCRTCRNAAHRRSNQKTGKSRRRRFVRAQMTEADYNRMLAEQNGVCAICGQPPRGAYSMLVIDHDHALGWRSRASKSYPREAVRGLLCDPCNRFGVAGDDPGVLRAAAAYLERYQTTRPAPPIQEGAQP